MANASADVQAVAHFVRRLRRLALHPRLDDQVGEKTPMPGDLIRRLISMDSTTA
jgi:hypothetical protein